MRSSKSILAGVAAGALALGALTIASAPAASAQPSIKPKATASATASAVRATGTGSSALNIASAKLTWRGTSLLSSGGFIDLTTAPTGGAIMTVNNSSGAFDDTVTLAQNGTPAAAYLIGDDTGVYFNVDTAGTYAGFLANGSDTVNFSFTTAGAPTSMTLTPATQTVLVGGVGTVKVTLKDAAGNTTQPQTVDSVAMSTSGDDTYAFTSATGAFGGNLQFGTFDDTIATQTAGTSTLTATPAGTLSASGVTAQTASLVKSGTVSSTSVASISVTAPVLQVKSGTAPSTSATAVPEGTTTVTVLVDDTTTAAAGNTIRLKAVLSAGTLNGTSTLTQYTDVTTNASKQATATFTIGGAGILSSTTLIVSQVNVSNAAVSPAAQNTVTQTTAAVSASTIKISPDDSQVAAIGTVTPVTVTVSDQFGTPQAGWTVQAFRGTTTGTFLTQGTTNASGVANVTVTNASGIASGTTENYSIKTYIGSITPVSDNNTLSIAYTTSGGISSLSVAVTGGGTTPVTNTTTSIAVLPFQLVPFGGTAGTSTTGTYTVSGGTGTAAGNVTTFTPTASPANNVTVTVPTGAKVSTASSTVWSGGAQTVTVSSGTPVYVFATKTGEHNVAFTSGGLTTTAKIRVATSANAAYDIALTPATQNLNANAFGTATVTITDVFGNAVPGADDTNAVTVTAAGEVRLGGLNVTQNVTVGSDGKGTISLVAGPSGAGTLSVVPKSGALAAAWQSGYTPPTGATAPKTSAAGVVTIGAGPVTKTITITGSRTTVSGKPGIEVDGITVGFEDGKTVIPYFRFPGETTYTEGTARPVITDDAFMWQRKTGKKFYAYVTSDDGAVQSNRVIIAAN
jgi:hypothetical protein